MARGMPIAGILLSFIFDLLAYGGFQKRKGAKRLYASLFQLSNKSVAGAERIPAQKPVCSGRKEKKGASANKNNKSTADSSKLNFDSKTPLYLLNALF
jgi:hypothetical protein